MPARDGAQIGSQNIESKQVSVTTGGDIEIVGVREGRISVTIKNQDGTNFIEVGDPSTHDATLDLLEGIRLLAGESITFFTQAAVYGDADTATCIVGVVEEYVTLH